MGLMNSPAKRAHGCGQWVRSYGVNELPAAKRDHGCGQWVRSYGVNELTG